MVVLLVQLLLNKQCSRLHESPVPEIYMHNAIYTYSTSHRKKLCYSVGKDSWEYTRTSEPQNTLLTDLHITQYLHITHLRLWEDRNTTIWHLVWFYNQMLYQKGKVQKTNRLLFRQKYCDYYYFFLLLKPNF